MTAPSAPAAAFIHPDARCESRHVGAGTRVWAFAHVLPGAVIGEGCNICDHVFIENRVTVGHHVTVKCGVQLWDGLTVEDHVFIGPNATFTNDRFPPNRGRPAPFEPLGTHLRHHATIGANATVLPGLTIGAHAMVAAGSVVTRDVPDHALVAGNPARFVRDLRDLPDTSAAAPASAAAHTPDDACAAVSTAFSADASPASGWTLLAHGCAAGAAAVDARLLQRLPFRVASMRVLAGDPCAQALAAHPHRFLLPLAGACTVAAAGAPARRIALDDPRLGLHLAQAGAVTLELPDPAALLLVLSS